MIKTFNVDWTFSPSHMWHRYNILKGIKNKNRWNKNFQTISGRLSLKKYPLKLLPCTKQSLHFLESTQRKNWMTHCNATLKPSEANGRTLYWIWCFRYTHILSFFYILTQYNASIKVKTAIYVCKCSAACLLHLAAVELASKWIRMHILNGGH